MLYYSTEVFVKQSHLNTKVLEGTVFLQGIFFAHETEISNLFTGTKNDFYTNPDIPNIKQMAEESPKINYSTNLVICILVILSVYLINDFSNNHETKYFWNILISIPISMGFCYKVSKKIKNISIKDVVFSALILSLFIHLFIYWELWGRC